MKKNDKKIKWDLNKKLLAFFLIIPVIAIFFIVIGNNNENNILMYIGFLLFPLMGIILIPNTIKYAFRECKELDNKYKIKKINLDKKLYKNENIENYHSKIIFPTIKNSIIIILLTIIVIILFFFISTSFFVNDGPERLNDRPIISKIFHKSRNIEGGAFLLFLGSVIFGIPIIIYNIIVTTHKLKNILNKKYDSYFARVNLIDLKDRIHLIGKNEKYTYIIDSYTCIGIRKKDIINKDVVIIFGLDKAYILPIIK